MPASRFPGRLVVGEKAQADEKRRLAGRTARPTSKPRGCSSVGRAPDLHSGGRRFDPDQLHQAVNRSGLKTGQRDPARGDVGWANGPVAQLARAHP